MLFTHFGLTGPLILSASAHLSDIKPGKYTAHIDLKPALDEKTLDQRLLSDFAKYNNKDFINALGDLLPHIVTCHLHDNNGYSDSHMMPGEGRIEWKPLLDRIRTAPRLVTMQSEVSMYRNHYSVRRLIETFDKLLAM